MSYILDALRRAEAERGRGAVPGIHSQSVPVSGGVPVTTRGAAWSVWIAGVVALVAVVAAAGAWWVAAQRGTPSGGVVVAAAGSVSPPAGVAAPPAVPAISPAPPVPVAPVEPVAAAPAAKRTAAPSREKADRAAGTAALPAAALPRARLAEAPRTPVREPADAVRQAPSPAVVAAAGAAGAAGATGAAPTSAVSATGTVFAQADLPDSVRGQLPVLKISGITYSSNAVSRMAIVNGQVLHEGDPAAPGLLLERIEPGRTVWSFKGYRYGLAP